MLKINSSRSNKPPSLIKWTGSKRAISHRIFLSFPEHKRYLEPFLGGGSVLYFASTNKSIAGDIYKPLVEFWQLVKDDPALIIADYTEKWTMLQNDFPDYFYKIREAFNDNPAGLELSFLARTCVNGIIRFNSEGKFNNSFHLSRKGMDPGNFKKVVYAWNAILHNVDFFCQDYKDTIEMAKEKDLVYLDPPYANSKQRYFSEINHSELLEQLESLNKRNVYWALSYDGHRGDFEYKHKMPTELYRRKIVINSGLSAVKKVLSNSQEIVKESLYVNF